MRHSQNTTYFHEPWKFSETILYDFEIAIEIRLYVLSDEYTASGSYNNSFDEKRSIDFPRNRTGLYLASKSYYPSCRSLKLNSTASPWFTGYPRGQTIPASIASNYRKLHVQIIIKKT